MPANVNVTDLMLAYGDAMYRIRLLEIRLNELTQQVREFEKVKEALPPVEE